MLWLPVGVRRYLAEIKLFEHAILSVRSEASSEAIRASSFKFHVSDHLVHSLDFNRVCEWGGVCE